MAEAESNWGSGGKKKEYSSFKKQRDFLEGRDQGERGGGGATIPVDGMALELEGKPDDGMDPLYKTGRGK